MSRTCIVLLTWNAPEVALRCLDSLLPILRHGNASLVVCDNGSKRTAVEEIVAWAKRHLVSASTAVGNNNETNFLLIQNGANLGYAAGNNVGIRFALQEGGFDAIWLLNQDTFPREDALACLRNCAKQHPESGAFGSTLISPYHFGVVQCAAGARYFPLTTIMRPCHEGMTTSDLAELDEPRLSYICGAAMYIRTEALKQVGLLNEDFFLYYEELDLAERLVKCGWKLGWCRDSQVYHEGSVSTGSSKRAVTAAALDSTYHENLSTLIFTVKHHPRLLPVAASFRFGAKNVLALMRLNPQALKPLWKAYKDFFLHGVRRRTQTEAIPRIILRGQLLTSN